MAQPWIDQTIALHTLMFANQERCTRCGQAIPPKAAPCTRCRQPGHPWEGIWGAVDEVTQRSHAQAYLYCHACVHQDPERFELDALMRQRYGFPPAAADFRFMPGHKA